MIFKLLISSTFLLVTNIAFSQVIETPDQTTKPSKSTKKSSSTQKKTYNSNVLPEPSKVTRDFEKAFYLGNLEIAELLLQQGADINCPNCNDSEAT